MQILTISSAYGPGHNTETAILHGVNNLLVQIDKREICILILLDLSAAFDTIEYGILLERPIQTFGITGSAIKGFESY